MFSFLQIYQPVFSSSPDFFLDKISTSCLRTPGQALLNIWLKFKYTMWVSLSLTEIKIVLGVVAKEEKKDILKW